MKKINLYILSFLLVVFSLSSCEDYFGDINVDPDNPTIVTPNVILPAVQARLAYAMGGDASRYTGLLTQHIDGVGRQFVVYQNYQILPSDLDGLWSNLYAGVLMDGRQIQTLSQESGYNHFNGIAKALEAYAFMFLTDMFGDIPYSEALQGTGQFLQPKFDTQESVYNNIFSILDEAKTLLAMDDGGLAVGGADLIYGGDANKWTKFCNVLEARGRLHLTKVDASNYQAALSALDRGGFIDSSDDARFGFGSTAAEAAPWFQYLEQRTDTQVGDSYVALMNSLGDPREATYGFPHTSEGDHPILKQDRNFPLLTYTEQMFIRAECLMQTGGDPADALNEAVTSSYVDAGLIPTGFDEEEEEQLYISSTDYVASLGSITMNVIATQKYIAMFNDPEAFNDWRRTNVPNLTPNAGNQVPRKLPLAESEVLANTNAPNLGLDEIFTSVWWDK